MENRRDGVGSEPELLPAQHVKRVTQDLTVVKTPLGSLKNTKIHAPVPGLGLEVPNGEVFTRQLRPGSQWGGLSLEPFQRPSIIDQKREQVL
jgi:hypothetical protein